jgi:hypothetical protein
LVVRTINDSYSIFDNQIRSLEKLPQPYCLGHGCNDQTKPHSSGEVGNIDPDELWFEVALDLEKDHEVIKFRDFRHDVFAKPYIHGGGSIRN